MSENSPEPALNGHGALNGSAANGSAANGSAANGSAANGHRAAAESQIAGVGGQAAAGEETRLPGRAADDLCRLTVCGPATSVELAVPVHVPLIDLLPALVGHLGDNLADVGLDHGGWVLQRLGEPPLQEELSVAVLGLHDGDMVHLRPRSDQLPPLDFDDIIDGIAVGISGRSDRWRPDMSRRLLTGLLAVPLGAGLGLLIGHRGQLADGIAAGLCVVLLALVAAASRAFGDARVAGILGAAAIGYAGAAGAELPMLHTGGGPAAVVGWNALRAGLLAGGAAAAGASAAVTMLVGGRNPALVGTTTVALLVAVGGALATFGRLDSAAVAAVLLCLILPLGSVVPVLSFRLAGLRLDPLPTTPDELQADLDPVPGRHLLERTRWADRYMSALYCALGAIVGGCLLVVSFATGWPARLIGIDSIALLLLHARAMAAARHRLAAIIPAACGATALITIAGLRSDGRAWLMLLAGLLAGFGLLFVGERSLPGHKLLPHWGRAGDLLQSLAALALIPLALWLLNLYQFARSVRG
jgi:type VII secretion integral membrane protein EccD